MYRIRFHGRGGQGIKTAGRVLGTAFFLEKYDVQDAPRYGAERRGAPIFAYVRASKKAINERGVINHPDLIIVADETLIPIPAAGVLLGATESTYLLINTSQKAEVWADRLNFKGKIITLSPELNEKSRTKAYSAGTICVGAAASLLGVISTASLQQALREELSELSDEDIEKNIKNALLAYKSFSHCHGEIKPGVDISAKSYIKPEWIELPFEDATISAPIIHAAQNSEKMDTGLWRVMRPTIDYNRCHGCWWICSTFCPDSAIHVNAEKKPVIDYGHCKGCLICSTICPSHAIDVNPEYTVSENKKNGAQ